MTERKPTIEELFRERPELFDYYDIEPDDRRDSPGHRAATADAIATARKHQQHPQPDDPAQSARFIEAAKDAGVSGKTFDNAFKKVAPAKRPSR